MKPMQRVHKSAKRERVRCGGLTLRELGTRRFELDRAR